MTNRLSLYFSQYQEFFGDDIFIKNRNINNQKQQLNSLISSIIESNNKSHFDKSLLNYLFTNIKTYDKFFSNNSDMNFIFGMGDINSDFFFISESPGCSNDPQELLFLGESKKLFDKILRAVNLNRENIYILNILKTNFSNNKNNSNDREIQILKNYLHKNLQLVKPKLIIFLGDSIFKKMLKVENNLEDMRKKVFKFLNIDCITTYHPNTLIRKNELKKNAWEDFKILRDKYLNDKQR
tara:strand:- start:598 stop:1314 length:717 start_codon:yes stop_codon:yes gene_type:complete